MAFAADPDAALRGLPEPVLLDEWQAVPSVLGAVKRAVDVDPRPGRYIVAVLRDGDLLGRILDTFVAAQIRAELPVSSTRPRLYHLRQESGRQEVDLLAELAADRVVAFEVKADAAPGRDASRHLRWLRDQLEDRFVAGVVFHTGPRIFPVDDRIVAAPVGTLWG